MTDNRTTEQTATERLRSLLDERGVEYETADGWWTSWDTDGASSIGAVVYCEDLGGGLEIRWHTITPEQAIAATLGTEYHGYEQAAIEAWESIKAWNARAERTCRIVEYDEAPYPVCSECGAVQPDDYTVYFCWNCGAKVRNE